MRSRLYFNKLQQQNKIVQDASNNENFGEESSLSESLIDLTAGSFAGMVQVIVGHPFDTIKVKQQTFPKMYSGMIDCFVRTYRNEGLIRGLYAGTLPALYANTGENAVLFLAYESCRGFVGSLFGLRKGDDLPIVGEALAGALGSCFSTFIVCPSELLKCRIQSIDELRLLAIAKKKPAPASLSMAKLMRNIYAAEGIRGFYRGLTATLVRDVPGYFCFFGCYEALKESMRGPFQSRDDVGPWITIMAAGIAGIFLWLITFPADVIKSRIQIKNLKSSMMSVGRHIICKDGVRALYHGLLPSIIQTIPSTATLFLVYEFVKKRLNKIINEKEEGSL